MQPLELKTEFANMQMPFSATHSKCMCTKIRGYRRVLVSYELMLYRHAEKHNHMDSKTCRTRSEFAQTKKGVQASQLSIERIF